ncbi:ABC transporter permease [Paenibacillus tuaregi]|uniref:ABC transporter permease n=1 Tax=Paenibacillus tuaregi TaxID=1816681 RepID=UPI000839595E|nr:hypothetical protein [Paenibacillus tuaregi]
MSRSSSDLQSRQAASRTLVFLRSQLCLEFKLLNHSLLLKVLPILFMIYMAWYLFRPLSNPPYLTIYEAFSYGNMMTVGIAATLGIVLVRRDLMRTGYEWSQSLPLTMATRIGAKFIAGVVYMTLLTAAALFIFIIFSLKHGVSGGVIADRALYFVCGYEISHMISLALAMLLAVCIPNRVVFMGGFIVWIFGTFFIERFVIRETRLIYLKIFSLNPFFQYSGAVNDLWGLTLGTREWMMSLTLLFPLALGMLAISIFLLNRGRPSFRRNPSGWAIVICIVAGLTAAVPYRGYWTEQYDTYQERMEDVSKTHPSSLNGHRDVKDIYPIQDTRIRLTRHKDDSLTAAANLTINGSVLNPAKEISLTLNRTFTVEGVKVDGKTVSFTRQGDSLRIHPVQHAGKELHINIVYKGKVLEFNPGTTNLYEAFVQGSNVLLPQYMAWYPLPGNQTIYESNSSLSLVSLIGLPMELPFTNFQLTAEGFTQPLYTGLNAVKQDGGVQIFEMRKSRGVSLFSGELAEMSNKDKALHVVSAPYEHQSAQAILNSADTVYRYFSSWLPNLKLNHNRLIILGNDMYKFSSEFNSESNYDYLLGSMYPYQQYGFVAEKWLNYAMFGTEKGRFFSEEEHEDVRPQIRSMFWYLYYRDQQKWTDRQIREKVNLYQISPLVNLEGTSRNPGFLKMRKQVAKAIDNDQSTKVKKVLSHFYTQGLEIPLSIEAKHSDFSKPISYADWEKEWKRVMEGE